MRHAALQQEAVRRALLATADPPRERANCPLIQFGEPEKMGLISIGIGTF
jgi:hypothetical protein